VLLEAQQRHSRVCRRHAIAIERANTDGCVAAADCVEKERLSPMAVL